MTWTRDGLTAIWGGGLNNTAMHTALQDGNGELSGNAYARVEVAGGGWTFAASLSSGVLSISNTAAISFPRATGQWRDPTGFSLYSAASGGTLYGSWNWPAGTDPDRPAAGDVLRFAAGQLTIPVTAGNFTRAGIVALLGGGLNNTAVRVGLGAGTNGTTELSGNGYGRGTNAAAGWTFAAAIASGSLNVSNSGVITFPNPTGDWTDPTHFTLHSAATGGTLWFRRALSNNPDQPEFGKSVSIAAGDLDITLTA